MCSAHRAHWTYTQNKLDKKAPFKWKSIYQVLTISEHISLSPLNWWIFHNIHIHKFISGHYSLDWSKLITFHNIHLFLSSFEFHWTATSSLPPIPISYPNIVMLNHFIFWSLFFKRKIFFFFWWGDGWIFNLSMCREMLTIFKMNESKKTFHSHYHQRRTMVRDV